jgi:hypothetical protein
MSEDRSLPSRTDNAPTWELFHRLNEGSNLPPVGKDAVRTALRGLERRLGPSWPKRQFRDQGWLPPELIGFSGYTAVLPQLLTLFVRLDTWADEPSLATVLSSLRKTCTTTDWRHTLLQLEVGRAARAKDWSSTFEPDIPGSANHGDLLLDTGHDSPVLVEATTLGRTHDDLLTERFEDDLQAWLRWLEAQYVVHTVTKLSGRLEPEAAQHWCEEVAKAATAVTVTGKSVTVGCSLATVTVHPGEAPVGIATFDGVPRLRDLSRRLRKMILEKAKQSAGPYPTWIRLDGLDGVFAFTPWAQAEPGERIARLADVLSEPLAAYPHVHGVIYSSGMAAGGYGVASGTLDATMETERGSFLRREIAPFLLRETIVLPVRPEGRELARAWATAYGCEPTWLDEDLTAHGLPRLALIRP